MKKTISLSIFTALLSAALMANETVDTGVKSDGDAGCCATLLGIGGTLTAPTVAGSTSSIANGMGKAGTISFTAGGTPTTSTPAPAAPPTYIAYLSGGSKLFNSSGTFIVPSNVQKIKVGLLGGGGGGGGGLMPSQGIDMAGGPGGGSGYYTTCELNVISGESIQVIVGGGGAGGRNYASYQNGTPGAGGQASSVKTCSAAGGGGGNLSVGGAGRINGSAWIQTGQSRSGPVWSGSSAGGGGFLSTFDILGTYNPTIMHGLAAGGNGSTDQLRAVAGNGANGAVLIAW